MNNNQCVDAGREGCPCQLGVYGKCLVCSRIGKTPGGEIGREALAFAEADAVAAAESCNRCSWSGTCIYTLYHQSRLRPAAVRPERSLEIAQVRAYEPEFKVYLVEADRGFCQKASAAGAYVFLRREGRKNWFDMPVSVLKSEPGKGLIHLGICGEGPKSRDALTAEAGDSFVIRGFFLNGLSGLPSTLELPKMGKQSINGSATAIAFAKGIAIAPLRNLFDDPRSGIELQNTDLYLDTEKIGWDFIGDYFGDIPAAMIHAEDFRELFSREGNGVPRQALMERQVLALTSPYYAELLEHLAGRPVIRPNPGKLCCGEGVCGACGFDRGEGEIVNLCKCR